MERTYQKVQKLSWGLFPIFLRLLICLGLILPWRATATVSHAQSLSVITIEVTTADDWWSGTDDDVHLIFVVASGNSTKKLEWNLDTDDDDFEKGDTNAFRLTDQLPIELCQVIAILITKSEDGFAGGWKLAGIKIYADDNPSKIIYQNSNVYYWLEDNHRDWLASDFKSTPCQPPLPPAPKTPPKPPKCTAEIIDKETKTKKQVSDTDCDGLADPVDPQPREPAKDSDGDGIPDPREELMGTDPFNPDTDQDGVPDGFEDKNWDGKLDPGETDPKNPDSDGDSTRDGQEDSDGDGLPDWYEVNTNPKFPDSDEDGWYDGPTNTRTFLILYKIECGDESEDVEAGDDELFLLINDVRFPMDKEDVDGSWDLEGDDVIYPVTTVGRWVKSPKQTASYQVWVEFWEDDVFDFTDDFWQSSALSFSTSGTVQVKYEDLHWYNDTSYTVTFLLYTTYFYDADPTKADSDLDHDGLTDKQEYLLSSDTYLRGMSDPANRDIFLEMDWVGEDQEPEEYSKYDVISQFFYHDYPIHMDDGHYGGGGQNLPYSDTVYLRKDKGTPSAEEFAKTYFSSDRQKKFHYALGVDSPGEFQFGVGTRPILNDSGQYVCGGPAGQNLIGMMIFKSDFFDHISDMESILFMHELGHTFGLCHRPEDPTPVVYSGSTCPGSSPPDCNKCDNYCSFYWVDQDSDTAMGSGLHFEGGPAAGGAILGGLAGVGAGFLVGGPVGAVVGGLIGFFGGLFGAGYLADLIDREVIYEDAEWNVLNLEAIKNW